MVTAIDGGRPGSGAVPKTRRSGTIRAAGANRPAAMIPSSSTPNFGIWIRSGNGIAHSSSDPNMTQCNGRSRPGDAFAMMISARAVVGQGKEPGISQLESGCPCSQPARG
jgi:hypothetical protein